MTHCRTPDETSTYKLCVTAQLVNVSDGYHVWSKVFDEDLADAFAIQDEIAAKEAASTTRP